MNFQYWHADALVQVPESKLEKEEERTVLYRTEQNRAIPIQNRTGQDRYLYRTEWDKTGAYYIYII